jgi:hypothetical protein
VQEATHGRIAAGIRKLLHAWNISHCTMLKELA